MAKILIVDDRPVNREFLVALLTHLGHRFLEAGDGAAALALVRSERPDLVITDLLMPIMDGYELVRRIRADPALAATPVIFSTAVYHEHEVRELARKGGVVRMFTKPADPELILRTVAEALDPVATPVTSMVSGDFDRDHLRLLTGKLHKKVAELETARLHMKSLVDFGKQLAMRGDTDHPLTGPPVAGREVKEAIDYLADELESRVRERTSELLDEIAERRRAEEVLEERIAARTVDLSKAIEDLTREADQRRLAQEAEARAMAILDATPDFVGMADPTGRPFYANRAGRLMVGRSEEEVSRTAIADCLPDWANEIVARVGIPTAIRAGSWAGEAAMLRRDGSEVPVSMVILAHKGPEGDVRFLSTIARDISERKRAEEANARLAAIVESSDDAIISKDLSGLVTSWNHGAERLFGYTAAEMVGTPIRRLIPPDRLDEELAILGRLKQGERVEHFESVRTTKDGRSVDVSLMVSPIRDASGAIVGASKIARDISDRKRTEQEIRLLNSQLERRLNRLNALRRIDTAITAGFDLRVTLDTLLDQVNSQLGVDAADVLLYDAPTRALRCEADRGFRAGSMAEVLLPADRGLASLIYAERKPVHLPDLTQSPRPFLRAGAIEEEGFVAYSGVPLISQGGVKGVLEVFHRSPIEADQEWLDFLGALAGHAAIAIDCVRLFEGLQRSNAELTVAYDATIEGWSRALDLRDKETEGHTRRVTETSIRLALALGLSGDDLIHVRRGALLHDIGKLGVPDSILLKPGKLTEEEWGVMRRHPGYAYEWLAPIDFLRPALEIPLCHHEKWDGTGYPRGLAGEDIPIAARLFAAVDICDALLSDRPYRQGWPVDKVREHIRSLSGTHLDPRVVDAFLPMIGAPGQPMLTAPSPPALPRTADAAGPDAELLGSAFRAILDNSADFVVLLDGSFRVLAASRSFSAAFAPGLLPCGLDFIGLLDSGSRDKFRAILSRPVEGSLTLEVNHLTRTKAIRLVNYSVYEFAQPRGARLLTAIGRGQEESLGLVEELVHLNQELEDSRKALSEQALTDPLTGLGNRRWLFEQLDILWATGRRQGLLPWVMMGDLDHFKSVNDTYGHQTGDDVLVAASRAMRGAVRTEDLVGRYGGEEFVLAGLCERASDPRTQSSRVLEAVRGVLVDCAGGPLRVTVSLGVAVAEPDPANPPWAVLQSADHALYRAKEGGRDRFEIEPGVIGRRATSPAVAAGKAKRKVS